MEPKTWLAALSAALLLGACGGGAAPQSGADGRSDIAALGEKLFRDRSLSASGRQSCASCHEAAHAHAPANVLAAQLGGPLGDQQGTRSAPSLRYLADNGAFGFDADGTPRGGFFWDGRAASLQAQARAPFLNPREMANASVAEVVQRLSRAPYAAEFRAHFGADIFDRPDDAFDRIALALAQYQREDPEFRPFSSKYDAVLRGEAVLSASESRGLALFNRADKGNCAACHPSRSTAAGSPPLFTDFSYDNLGLPRNRELAVNADRAYFDLGLCQRAELAARTDLCGAFKVPSLRNVAARGALFHNGRFKSLKEALSFYVQRDTHPEKWYPLLADGTLDKFDDLPPAHRANVNKQEAPYNRRPGDAPALSDAEIDDVIAFLKALSDGFLP